METAFTRLVGCTKPIQQAGMGVVATPELARAVADAGGLGMLCHVDREPAAARMARVGSGAVGMGFFGQWLQHDLATFEAAAAQLRVVELFWATPDTAVVERARGAGEAFVGWQIGSVDHARAAEDAGCDFVIAQGVEAGGHVLGTTPRDELLGAVLEVVSIPVVSAGGITTSGDVANVLRRGAGAVRVGTAFAATVESGAHPRYVDALIRGNETILTTAFSVGWPDAKHRVLTTAVTAADAAETDIVAQNASGAVARYSTEPPDRTTTGNIDAMALYAGMGVGAINAVRSAAQVIADLTAEIA